MNWMKSTYQAYYGHQDINADAVTTGKSKTLGGISGRRESQIGIGPDSYENIRLVRPNERENISVIQRCVCCVLCCKHMENHVFYFSIGLELNCLFTVYRIRFQGNFEGFSNYKGIS